MYTHNFEYQPQVCTTQEADEITHNTCTANLNKKSPIQFQMY